MPEPPSTGGPFATRFSPDELTALRPLQRQFSTLDAAVAQLARLAAEKTLPKGAIHVISDIHGDDTKLRHVINNASGTLRPLVEQMFAREMAPAELQQFLALLFYPRETLERPDPALADTNALRIYCRRVLRQLFELVGRLARRRSPVRAARVFPVEYRELFQELLHEPAGGHGPDYYEAIIDTLVRHGRALQVIRLTVHAVRNLAVDELIIGGDCWDRGPRGDRVVDHLMHQPDLAFTWGNHDAAWLGACLGQEALIAHVLRISCRYRRLSQLEEGYGINLQPLERLARTVYADDPATCYPPKGDGLREKITMARLQKAAAVMQYKLEGQMIARNPEWGLDARRLLHHMDRTAGTVQVDGKSYPLRDTHFPTIDPADPYALSPDERVCMDRIKQSFASSQKLWEHMEFLLEHGSMYLVRDDNLIFHGCVPVDDKGEFLPLQVDGRERSGRPLFDALDDVLARVPAGPSEKDRDLMWYLWCGPRSPLFGKDKIATFEIDLVADAVTHEETKNPYFKLIHEVPFCDRILREFGVDTARGLIVNGHVPVKIDKGESPLKRSGKAITIDGAFSKAYGDHGYTLLLEPDRTLLAKHHHFESVEAAVAQGVDIIPEVTVIRQWDAPRQIGDTERGAEIARQIALLERLVHAYRTNQLRQG
jgi:fructose-1,6-bisphosphatase III